VTADGGADERTALLESSGQIVYQWGEWGPPSGAPPQLERPLPAPLQAWRLAWWGVTPADTASGVGFNLLAGLLAVGLALIGLAVWFYRESARDLRRAARRVSFVNQVSHELKTPLTNIRMYAELLEDELVDEDERAERYVRVIVQEAQRLSRLIGNVLTFARHQREQLEVRPTAGVVDELVRGVVEQFEPALSAVGVTAELQTAAPATVRFDHDALGQILGNLLGNVEKYAASGDTVEVRTAQNGAFSEVRVVDSGPGIPRAHRARVFEPFHRVSDAVSDGVTGTGIGLGIARDLARMHGGDLTLEPSDAGASFLIRIRTEPAGGTT
jgi:signal transduction histidine kinase